MNLLGDLFGADWFDRLVADEAILSQIVSNLEGNTSVLSGRLSVTGDVGNPATYNSYTLAMQQPVTTETAHYLAAGTPVTDTYTGIGLWNLLNNTGGVLVDTAKNDILGKIVVATGTDGYRVVFSAGEIDPAFGNQPIIVADADNGGQLGFGGADGFARMVVPGDLAGGRYVSNLDSLQVELAPAATAGAGGVSPAFVVGGDVAHAMSFNLASLQALGQSTTETATYSAGGTPVTDTYTGVSLWTLLNDAGLVLDPDIKNDVLGQYVVATGSDGYQAVFSMGEIDPAFGGQKDLVAYADTGNQLGASGPDGFARIVVPGDAAGGRYVSNVVSLQVYDTHATTA